MIITNKLRRNLVNENKRKFKTKLFGNQCIITEKKTKEEIERNK